ncbi:hypothetical protein [Pantoea sp. B65]
MMESLFFDGDHIICDSFNDVKLSFYDKKGPEESHRRGEDAVNPTASGG